MQSIFHIFLRASSLAVLTSCAETVNRPNVVDRTQYVIVVVSGFDSDPSAEQIAGTAQRGSGNSGIFQLKGDLDAAGLECKFFNWNGTVAGQFGKNDPAGAAEIASWIEKRAAETSNTEFIFLGHSWGAHTLFDVASQISDSSSIRVPFAVMLDASSALRGASPSKLPENIVTLVNYHTGNMFCWGPLKSERKVKNINLGEPTNGFMENGFPKYGSAFDISAHVSAEWDQKIHRDIYLRILAVVGEQSND